MTRKNQKLVRLSLEGAMLCSHFPKHPTGTVKEWELFVHLKASEGASTDHQKNLLFEGLLWTTNVHLRKLNCQKRPEVTFYDRVRVMFWKETTLTLITVLRYVFPVSCGPYLRCMTGVASYRVLECHLEGHKDLLRKMPEVLKDIWLEPEKGVIDGQHRWPVLTHGRQERCLSGLSQERRRQSQPLSTAGFQAMGGETFNC